MTVITKETFSTRLRFFREKMGASQEKLARDIGVSMTTIANWENGRYKNAPGADKLEALARIFGVTMDFLWTGAPQTGSQKVGGKTVKEDYVLEAHKRMNLMDSRLALLNRALVWFLYNALPEHQRDRFMLDYPEFRASVREIQATSEKRK